MERKSKLNKAEAPLVIHRSQIDAGWDRLGCNTYWYAQNSLEVGLMGLLVATLTGPWHPLVCVKACACVRLG